MTSVSASPNSVAGLVAAYLVAARGATIYLEPVPPPRDQFVELSREAYLLLRDIVGDPARIPSAHAILETELYWGDDRAILSAPSLILSLTRLLQWLRGQLTRRFPNQVILCRAASGPDYQLSQKPIGAIRLAARAPWASVTTVPWRNRGTIALTAGGPDGWARLSPVSLAEGFLQIFTLGPKPASLEVMRRILANMPGYIVEQAAHGMAFRTLPAGPLLYSGSVCGTSIAVGTGAMRLDPICGDGVGHSVRTAILAAALIKAGEGRSAGNAEFETRVERAFGNHLRGCIESYSRLPSSPLVTEHIANLIDMNAELTDPRNVPALLLDGLRLRYVENRRPLSD